MIGAVLLALWFVANTACAICVTMLAMHSQREMAELSDAFRSEFPEYPGLAWAARWTVPYLTWFAAFIWWGTAIQMAAEILAALVGA